MSFIWNYKRQSIFVARKWGLVCEEGRGGGGGGGIISLINCVWQQNVAIRSHARRNQAFCVCRIRNSKSTNQWKQQLSFYHLGQKKHVFFNVFSLLLKTILSSSRPLGWLCVKRHLSLTRFEFIIRNYIPGSI